MLPLHGARVRETGLLSWGGLLSQLASRAGFSDDEQRALSALGLLDQPTVRPRSSVDGLLIANDAHTH